MAAYARFSKPLKPVVFILSNVIRTDHRDHIFQEKVTYYLFCHLWCDKIKELYYSGADPNFEKGGGGLIIKNFLINDYFSLLSKYVSNTDILAILIDVESTEFWKTSATVSNVCIGCGYRRTLWTILVSLRALQYYHATPGEPCKGSPGVVW